jgi:hypothetical protein
MNETGCVPSQLKARSAEDGIVSAILANLLPKVVRRGTFQLRLPETLLPDTLS